MRLNEGRYFFPLFDQKTRALYTLYCSGIKGVEGVHEKRERGLTLSLTQRKNMEATFAGKLISPRSNLFFFSQLRNRVILSVFGIRKKNVHTETRCEGKKRERKIATRYTERSEKKKHISFHPSVIERRFQSRNLPLFAKQRIIKRRKNEKRAHVPVIVQTLEVGHLALKLEFWHLAE